MSIRSLAVVAALAASVLAVPNPAKTKTTASPTAPTTTLLATATNKAFGLNDAAKQAGKLWFGTAADIPGTGEAQDPFYMREFKNQHDFGEATPANIMKVCFHNARM
jgi:endo-1,4-beta-xylanase